MSLSVIQQPKRLDSTVLHAAETRLVLDVAPGERGSFVNRTSGIPVPEQESRCKVCLSDSELATCGARSASAEVGEVLTQNDSSVTSASNRTGLDTTSGRLERLTAADLSSVLQGRCERCGAEHDRSFGSGRFCSVQCARKVAAKAKWERYRDRKRQACSSKQQGRSHADASPLPVHALLLGKQNHLDDQKTLLMKIWAMNYASSRPPPSNHAHQNNAKIENQLLVPLDQVSDVLPQSIRPFPSMEKTICTMRQYYGRGCSIAPVADAQAHGGKLAPGLVALPPFSVAFGDCVTSGQSRQQGKLCRSFFEKECLPPFCEVLRFAKPVNKACLVRANHYADPFRYLH
jgi:hypothetical protein